MGPLLFKGMKVGIQEGDFSISFNEDGTESSRLVLSTSYNMLPVWLRIAYDNILNSRKANEAIASEWIDNPESQKSLLVAELSPSIQVFVACGCALDALYDQVKDFAKITTDDIEKWKSKKTSRSAQIVEVIRRAYKLDNHFVKSAKLNINSILEFRDKVVHPSHEIQRPCTRPDIPVSVDWRFSAYRYSNASIAYRRTMELLILLHEKKSSIESLDKHMDGIFESLLELGLVEKNAQKNA